MTDEGDPTPNEGRGDESSRPGTDATTRIRVTASRADDGPEWELFLRTTPEEPLRHAGSVTAPSVDHAHEEATALFPEATTIWCCRAAEVARFTERDLGADYREGPAAQGGEEA